MPTITKSRPVITPWLNICKAAPVMLTWPSAAMPSSTYPIWLTLE